MARLLFLQNLLFEYLGPMSISALGKSQGHQCDLLIESGEKDFLKKIGDWQPDIVAFSCMTGFHPWALETAQKVKAIYGLKTYFGGPHATFYPQLIEHPAVDIICRGEGEEATIELLNKIDTGEEIADIANLWLKEGGKVFKNEVRPLEDDLDRFPDPSREIYYKYRYLKTNPNKYFLSGRGCPYDCTFCFNHEIKELYKNKGTYLRKRGINRVITEILEIKERYGIGRVRFIDDTFIIDRDWCLDFLERYEKEVALPFSCSIRANLTSPELIKSLKEAGCEVVYFGVESGNDFLRNNILGKGVSKEQLIKTAHHLKRYRLKFQTFNLFGIPGESLQEALETVNLNVAMGTDYPWSAMLQPYPGTLIEKYAREQGFLNQETSTEDFTRSFFNKSPINQKAQAELLNLQKLFPYAVKFPRLIPLIKKLINLRPNALYELLFLAYFAYRYMKISGVGLGRIFYLLKNRKRLY